MKRHDLVYLNVNQKFTILGTVNHEIEQYLKTMIDKGMPFTVCRQTLTKGIKLATSCLISEKKYRVSLVIYDKPRLITSPLLLNNLSEHNLIDAKKIIDNFIDDCSNFKAECYVYGSYANQYIAGLNFVHDTSDLDLLIKINDTTQWFNILKLIHDFQKSIGQSLGLKVDGEIRIADYDISFNELTLCIDNKIETIIAKNLTSIELKNIYELIKGDDYECYNLLNITGV